MANKIKKDEKRENYYLLILAVKSFVPKFKVSLVPSSFSFV